MRVKPPYIKPSAKESSTATPAEKKNPYDSRYFWKISYSELLADAGIIAFAFYFSQFFFKENNILTIIKPWQLIGLYAVVALTLPWYLGYLYAHWNKYYKKIVNKIVKWFFIAIVLASLVYLMVLAMSVPWDDLHKTDKITENFAMFAMFLLVLGPMMCIPGFMAGEADCEQPEKDGSDINDPSVTSVMMIVVLAIGFMIWWANADYTQKHSWLILPIYIGACVAAVIVFGIYYALLSLLKKMGIYKILTRFAQYLFPLFIVTVLILWNEIGMRLLLSSDKNAYASISFGRLIFLITVSGFIPFRLIMILTPPLRLINLLIGVLAFVLYLYNIRLLCV